MFVIGVLQSLSIVLILSFFFVYIRVSSLLFDIESVVFTTMSMIATALTLSLLAGPGRFVSATLKSWQTWFYSFVLILEYILYVILVHHVSGTEVGIIHQMAIPVTLVIALMYFGRKPSLFTLLGNGVMLIGFAVMVMHQGLEVWDIIWLPAVLLLLENVGHAFVTETHKQYSDARAQGTLRDRMRIVGFVSFISAALTMLISLAMVYLGVPSFIPNAAAIEGVLPPPGAFLHTPSVLLGVFYGLIFAPIARYFTWASVQNIKSENMMAIMALIPLVTLMIEWGMSRVITAATFELDINLFLSALLVSLGASLPVLVKFHHEHKRSGKSLYKIITQPPADSLSIHHADYAQDDYEMICATLEHAEGDKTKAAETLNLPLTTFEVLLEGKGSLALREGASKEVARRYRSHVANRDSLTGLLNRGGFMVALKKAIAEHRTGAFFYIDLNKFKPVNDTFGHDAGDAVLIQAAERLGKTLPDMALMTRIGGDEFCAYVPDATPEKAASILDKLQKNLAKKYKVKGIRKHIEAGAAIGTALYPTDATTPQDLITAADEGMFGAKRSVES